MRTIAILILLFILPGTKVFALPMAEVAPDDTAAINSYKNMYKLDNKSCQVYDPFEKLNRKIYHFNSVVDYFLLRPIAKIYDRITNDYTKARVGSFVNNVTTPLTFVNYGLQADYNNGAKSFWRFLINTTFGIGGLFDVAGKMGLNVQSQTFGSTLARYGVAPGPYLVLPLLGSTMMRDATDPIFTNSYLNPLSYAANRNTRYIFYGGKLVHERAAVLPLTDYIMHNSLDPYIAVRSSVYQNREANVVYPDNFVCPR
jgi:phospholipid-binding lipoprotein MlaA